MIQLIDKALLVLISIAFLFLSRQKYLPVIALLLAVTLVAVGSYAENRKVKSVFILCVSIASLKLPELIFFLPVFLYDCFQNRLRAGFSFLLPAFFYILIPSSPFAFEDVPAGSGEACIIPLTLPLLLLYLGLLLLALVLSLRTERLLKREQEIICLRDTSTELNLVLKEKNKNLLEKQDYEIHLATLKERNRIAREIHDHVGHMLSRSILQMGALATVHKEEPLHGELIQVNDTLNLAMTNIRESVHDLHDESIDLKQSLIEAVKPLRERCKLALDYDMSGNVPKNIKYCFIATTKEAVSNIIKHSDASEVTLLFREHPGFFQLTVEDNGSQNVPALEKLYEKGGIGLTNMKERVEAMNGRFWIRTGQGFKVFLSIPKELNES